MQVYLGSLDNQPMSTLEAGDCAGEISFIDNDHPSAYVVATRPSTVLRLHREALSKLFQQSPQMMQNLLELLCERVRTGNRIILDTEQNANVDTLTGLYNRRWLEHIYERESTRCAFNGHPMCLLMLDVDHFKAYNDRHGHLAGDYALCLVAHTLRNQLRPGQHGPLRRRGIRHPAARDRRGGGAQHRRKAAHEPGAGALLLFAGGDTARRHGFHRPDPDAARRPAGPHRPRRRRPL